MKHPYAQNREKLARAIGELGPDATDEAIREKYLALGGALQFVNPEPVEAPTKTTKKAAKKKK